MINPHYSTPIKIREIVESDVQEIVGYWKNADDHYLSLLGLSRERVPEPTDYTDGLRRALTADKTTRKSATFIAIHNGKAIGHIAVRDVVRGQDAEMHYHMHRNAAETTSLGSTARMATNIFLAAARHVMTEFDLQTLRCEPGISNPLPNRLLQHLGFTISEVITRTSGLSAGKQANRYIIKRSDVGLSELG